MICVDQWISRVIGEAHQKVLLHQLRFVIVMKTLEEAVELSRQNPELALNI